jgi:hypothetical protein
MSVLWSIRRFNIAVASGLVSAIGLEDINSSAWAVADDDDGLASFTCMRIRIKGMKSNE